MPLNPPSRVGPLVLHQCADVVAALAGAQGARARRPHPFQDQHAQPGGVLQGSKNGARGSARSARCDMPIRRLDDTRAGPGSMVTTQIKCMLRASGMRTQQLRLLRRACCGRERPCLHQVSQQQHWVVRNPALVCNAGVIWKGSMSNTDPSTAPYSDLLLHRHKLVLIQRDGNVMSFFLVACMCMPKSGMSMSRACSG